LRLVAALAGGILAGVGCGGGGGAGTGGTGGGAAGSSGSAGRGGAGGSSSGGTTGGAGSAGTTGTGGSAGSAAGTGGGSGGTSVGGGGAGGRGGTSAAGTAGVGGTAGRGGAGGTAGRGGSGGTSGGGGRGGAAGGAGTTGTAGSSGTTGGGGSGGGAGSAGRGGAGGELTIVRIMPLGDSTTASICYRSHLAQLLNAASKTYNFIGSRMGDPGCSFTNYDRDNEGHGGYIVTDLLKAAGTGQRPGGADTTDPFVSDARDLATWFDNRPADIVLMHFGTNDVWNNIAPATILNAYTTILTKLRAVNPNVRVLVAQITSLQPSGCNDCPTRVTNLNNMIPTWASQNSTAASPVSVVDQNTGFNPATDTADGVHANDAGATKIANKWFTALSTLL